MLRPASLGHGPSLGLAARCGTASVHWLGSPGDQPGEHRGIRADFRERIQQVLDDFLDEQAARLAPLGDDAARLVAEARTSVRGGKRFRAAFCYWGFRAIRPEVADETALVRACAALELLHASALVHDDFMDASDTRRGRPATHRAFEAEHRHAGLERRPGAVRRRRGDPARRPAARLGRRAAAPLRAPDATRSCRRSTSSTCAAPR